MSDDVTKPAEDISQEERYLQGMRAYGEHWLRVGPILAEIERKELLAMDESKRQEANRDLLELADTFVWTSPSSGLVEWYRLITKLKP